MVSYSRTLTVLSCDPVAMILSFGETVTELMSLSCARIVFEDFGGCGLFPVL